MLSIALLKMLCVVVAVSYRNINVLLFVYFEMHEAIWGVTNKVP